MSEDINKHLLSQFYGFCDDDSERKFLSSSKGIESFENVTDVECLSTEHLISSEETGKNQVKISLFMIFLYRLYVNIVIISGVSFFYF